MTPTIRSRDGNELFYAAGPNRFVVTSVTERARAGEPAKTFIPRAVLSHSFRIARGENKTDLVLFRRGGRR
jgi:hypothetical protein